MCIWDFLAPSKSKEIVGEEPKFGLAQVINILLRKWFPLELETKVPEFDLKDEDNDCCNFNFGLMTKARAYKGAGHEWSPWITFHALGSVGKCDGMNPHTFKWVPTLGVGLSMDFWIFKRQFQRSKFIGLKISIYHWKALETQMSKMGSHDPFGYLKHMLWPKERSGVKLPIWLPTIKSKKSPWFTYMQLSCHMSLKIYQQGLFFFKPHLNWRSSQDVMGFQSHKSPHFGNFKIPKLGVPRQNDIWV
jgi:hypothetical protein